MISYIISSSRFAFRFQFSSHIVHLLHLFGSYGVCVFLRLSPASKRDRDWRSLLPRFVGLIRFWTFGPFYVLFYFLYVSPSSGSTRTHLFDKKHTTRQQNIYTPLHSEETKEQQKVKHARIIKRFSMLSHLLYTKRREQPLLEIFRPN